MPEAEKRARVGCGALIKNQRGEILLMKRLRSPELGHWGFPGGKVDFGETVEAAIHREILEELGVTLRLLELAHLVNYIDLELGIHWLAPVYLASIQSGEPRIMEPEAHSEWSWFAPNALPATLTQATRQTLSRAGISQAPT